MFPIGYERNKLIDADKLHCVEVMVNSGKKALHYSVQHKLFGAMMNPGGDDEETSCRCQDAG